MQHAQDPNTSTPFRVSTTTIEPGTTIAMTESIVAEQDEGSGDARANSDFTIPDLLKKGTIMTRISESKMKKEKRVFFQLDPDEGKIIYESKKIGVIQIETIQEIRSGYSARSYRAQFGFPQDAESRWITIIFVRDGVYKTTHILADTPDVFNMWDSSLRKIFAIRQGLMSGVGNLDLRQTVWERQYWKLLGANRDDNGHRLRFEDVEWLCWKLNANVSIEDLRALFKTVDIQQRGSLDFAGFKSFIKLLKKRPDIEQLYGQLCSENGGSLNFTGFRKFTLDSQKSTATDEELQFVFAKYSSSPVEKLPTSSPAKLEAVEQIVSAKPADLKATSPSLSLDGFATFLLSSDNAAFSEKDLQVWHDMNRPMSEYFISSSHNTYLVGNQLVGVSTVEGYIRALLHSCRTVELDVYDGPSEPFVFHGNTLTSKIAVRDICLAISKYAFVSSPYPVIISAEVHCGLKQQDLMVQIMMEVFGDRLVRAPIEGRDKIEALPSPEALKGRILLKARNLYVAAQLDMLRNRNPPRNLHNFETEADSSDSSDSPYSSDAEPGHGVRHALKEGLAELKHKWQHIRRKVKQTPHSSSRHRAIEKPKKLPVSLSLATLLVYTVGVKFRGFQTGSSPYAPEHVFSISENGMKRLLRKQNGDNPSNSLVEVGLAEAGLGMAGVAEVGRKDEGRWGGEGIELVEHTKRHIVRVYPKGTRVGSTNFKPHQFWATGAQAVALNWQTFDLGYMMNMAMFQRNGRAGYVLKPRALRGEGSKKLLTHTKQVLDITIISAQQLPCLNGSAGQESLEMDPFVEVKLYIPDWTHLLPSSSTPQQNISNATIVTPTRLVTRSTKVVKRNGFNPEWKEKLSLPFDCVGGVEMRHLIFVEFVVRQNGSGDEEVASYFTPLGSLEMGYRYLPLHDAQRMPYLFSTLFVKTTIHDVE